MSSIDPSQASMHVIHIRPLERLPARSPESTRFVLVSDTHTHTFPVPDGDILLHAGDLTVCLYHADRSGTTGLLTVPDLTTGGRQQQRTQNYN